MRKLFYTPFRTTVNFFRIFKINFNIFPEFNSILACKLIIQIFVKMAAE